LAITSSTPLSWRASVTEADGSGFGADNLPFGVDAEGHVVVANGTDVIDLAVLGGLEVGVEVFSSGSLNAFMALGPEAWLTTRTEIAARLDDLPAKAVRHRADVRLELPFEVADYIDFYASEEHATAMGRLLRPTGDPLPSAWKHLPLGYHGRSATVVVDGTPVPRPWGIVAGDGPPSFRPSARLDVEVELGFVVGVGSRRGTRIAVERADEHVFGVVLLNDWSARDIQAFEYQPLGPFLGKSFATSVSPWVVPLVALDRFRVPGPRQVPTPSAHLIADEPRNFDIRLSLELNGTAISSIGTAGLYWSMAQQLAHLTSNGAATRTGDLFASGTISGSGPNSAGSLMEVTSAGRDPIKLDDGSTRTWLEDGDEVVIRGWCGEKGSARFVDLGEVRGAITAWQEEVAS